jgi:hypothetical protein
MDQKTIAIVLGFVLLVITLVIVTIALFNLSNNPIPFKVPEAVVLEQAIACSYWRCVEGCRSTHIQDTPLLACRTDFCSASYTDTKTIDGKICDDNSKAHPVVADTAGSDLGQSVYQNVLIQLTSSKVVKNRFYVDPSGDNCADLGAPPVHGVSYVAYFDNQKVIQPVSHSSFCFSLNIFGGPNWCYDEIEIQYGNYYVWTTLNPSGGVNTIACSTSPATATTTTTTIGCGDAGGVCYPENCPTGMQELQGTCPQGRDTSRLCCKAAS